MTEMGSIDPGSLLDAGGGAAGPGRAARLIQREASRGGQVPRIVYGTVTARNTVALTFTASVAGGPVADLKMANGAVPAVGSTVALLQTDGAYLGVGTVDQPAFAAVFGAWNGGFGTFTPPDAVSGFAFTSPAAGLMSGTIGATGFSTAGGNAAYYFYVNGVNVASTAHYFNQANVHLPFLPGQISGRVVKGTNYLWVQSVGVVSDTNDRVHLSATVLPA